MSRLEDRLDALEARAVGTGAIAAWLALLDELRLARARLTPDELEARVREVLEGAEPPRGIADELGRLALGSYRAASAEAYGPGRDASLDRAIEMGASAAALVAIGGGLALGIGAARLLARTRKALAGGVPAEDAIAALTASSGELRAAAARATYQTANRATTAAADDLGRSRVWIAEANACATCLRYSGVVAGPGEDFPTGLSYSPRPGAGGQPVDGSLHPNCRCHVEVLVDTTGSYPAALRREADRSILLGYSLASESRLVRLEALEALLDSDVVAPKSVLARARGALKRGGWIDRGGAGARARSKPPPK